MPCCRLPQGRFPILVAGLAAALTGGCAPSGMPSGSQQPTLTGNTNVIVLLTSTANDRLEDFLLPIASISLIDEKGNVATLYANPGAGTPGLNAPAEFMHLNGVAEPLVTVTVPQANYVSATVKASYCSFTEISLDASQAISDSTWAEGLCGQGTGNTTVNLPSPITVTGSGMALSLNLQVPQSYTLTGTGTTATYTISPVFTLSEVPISSQPTSNENGKITGIDAQITSTNEAGNSFVAQTPDGISMTVRSGTGTAYEGIASFSSLGAGMSVNLDMDIESDASLTATHVEVDSASAGIGIIGPLMTQAGSHTDEFITVWLEGEGCTNSGVTFCGNVFQYTGNTVFIVSGQLSNLQNLPFTATFSNSNITPGRMLSVYSSGVANQQSVEGATTVLLAPQSINATVTSVSNTNGFSAYALELAPYSLIPTLEGQSANPYPAVTLPANVVAYADSNTRMLNSAPITVGSVLRFRGVIFYDNGTLRMDCVQVNDGVTE
jgi:hypothetical protein